MIQQVLARGLDHKWSSKEVGEVLGLAERTVQQMAENGVIPHMGFTTRRDMPTANRKARRYDTSSLVLFLLSCHQGQLTLQEILHTLAPLLTQLSDAVLLSVEDACAKIRRRRANQLVIATATTPPPEPKASARVLSDPTQLDLFTET